VCTAENWRFSQLVEVKRLPLTVRVRRVYQPGYDSDDDVDLTGHKLRLLGVDDVTFLRTNAINSGTTIFTRHSCTGGY